ncbi:MAG: serine/threonine protein kinase [Magnetococcales bacterium]|nr:serine/threonine protein kinase [Magnetococcales bacterium]
MGLLGIILEGLEPLSAYPATLGGWRILAPSDIESRRGIVRGLDPAHDRVVAIKSVPFSLPEGAERQAWIARLRHEATIAVRLAHPNIVPLLEQGEDQGVPYLVYAWQPEATVRERLDQGWLPDLAGAVSITQALLTGLAHIHARGYRHGDLKPSNLFLTSGGAVHIVDFGAARPLDAPACRDGRLTGTHGFMPPEQLMGLPIDERADLFAVGVILYELLTRSKPFLGSDSWEITLRVLGSEPPALVGEAARLNGVVWQALAKRPEARFGSAQAFAEALRETLGTEGGSVVIQPPPVTVVQGPKAPGPPQTFSAGDFAVPGLLQSLEI